MDPRSKGSNKRLVSARQGMRPEDYDFEQYDQYDQTPPTAYSRGSPPERRPSDKSPPVHAIEHSRSLHDSSRYGPPGQGQRLPYKSNDNDDARYEKNSSAVHSRGPPPPPEGRPTAPTPPFLIESSRSYPVSSRHGPPAQGQILSYAPNPPIGTYSVPPSQSIQTSGSGNQTTRRTEDSYNNSNVSLDQSASLRSESNVNVINIHHLQIHGKPEIGSSFAPPFHSSYVPSSQSSHSARHPAGPTRSAISGSSPDEGDDVEYKQHRPSPSTKETSHRRPRESEARYRYQEDEVEAIYQEHRGDGDRVSSARRNQDPRVYYSGWNDDLQNPPQRPILGDSRSFSYPPPISGRVLSLGENENSQAPRKRPLLGEMRAISDPVPLFSDRYSAGKERPNGHQDDGLNEPRPSVYQQRRTKSVISDQSRNQREEESPLETAVSYQRKSLRPKEAMQPLDGRDQSRTEESTYGSPSSFPDSGNRQAQTSSTDSIQTVRAGNTEGARPVDKGKRHEAHRNSGSEGSHSGGTRQAMDGRRESTNTDPRRFHGLGYQCLCVIEIFIFASVFFRICIPSKGCCEQTMDRTSGPI
ncbi:hypothetical protein HYPSUDRAFT_533704 [Hypholoma sublateritium FD-334 SS-4]|uniref:Uncharacterized protein n=1 Tax=Hypholoma sublateritium (strain FD-334 SS-4) TaxID=945553 RepID=A0A0D2MKC9_HYPSF|nr:hypothetical protein HYPSUDRAFT_533704 [Hypholoma sublateritium FD-334 SS-4]